MILEYVNEVSNIEKNHLKVSLPQKPQRLVRANEVRRQAQENALDIHHNRKSSLGKSPPKGTKKRNIS